mmetsp:Transcript_28335/g.68108  ORF Transcript_28335/g.68108 Transcript_28335/m.68108 type:complete len:248 (-) Transcript_28335:249-992(-)
MWACTVSEGSTALPAQCTPPPPPTASLFSTAFATLAFGGWEETVSPAPCTSHRTVRRTRSRSVFASLATMAATAPQTAPSVRQTPSRPTAALLPVTACATTASSVRATRGATRAPPTHRGTGGSRSTACGWRRASATRAFTATRREGARRAPSTAPLSQREPRCRQSASASQTTTGRVESRVWRARSPRRRPQPLRVSLIASVHPSFTSLKMQRGAHDARTWPSPRSGAWAWTRAFVRRGPMAAWSR